MSASDSPAVSTLNPQGFTCFMMVHDGFRKNLSMLIAWLMSWRLVRESPSFPPLRMSRLPTEQFFPSAGAYAMNGWCGLVPYLSWNGTFFSGIAVSPMTSFASPGKSLCIAFLYASLNDETSVAMKQLLFKMNGRAARRAP